MAEYAANNNESRRKSAKRLPEKIKRPASAFLFFLQTFKSAFEFEHPDENLTAAELSNIATEKWKSMTPEEKENYEEMSTYSKDEYHDIKQLSSLDRMASVAELALEIENSLS